jgi:hypothetical protein
MTARDTLDLTVKRVIRAPRQKVFDRFLSLDFCGEQSAPREASESASWIRRYRGARELQGDRTEVGLNRARAR